jgi:hypothetical protein
VDRGAGQEIRKFFEAKLLVGSGNSIAKVLKSGYCLWKMLIMA